MSELCALGAGSGADVPFALMGGTCRVQGVGDVIKAQMCIRDSPVTREYLTRYLKTLPRLRGVRLACVVRSAPRACLLYTSRCV